MNRLKRCGNFLVIGSLLFSLRAGTPARADRPADPMEHAREQINQFEWQNAFDEFTAIANAADPYSERWAQATFGAAIASCNVQPLAKRNADLSADLFTAIITHTPTSKYAPRAVMKLGRLKELRDFPGDVPDLDGAREQYLKVAATWPNDPIAGEATLRAAATLVQAYDTPDFVKVKQGIALLEAWVAAHPNDPMISMMWQYLGDSYFMPLNDFNKSLACYEKVDSIGWLDAGNQGPLYWRSAVMAERTGQTPIAVKYYTKIVNETPNSGKAYEAQLALERLGAPVPKLDLSRSIATDKSPTTSPATSSAASPTKPLTSPTTEPAAQGAPR